jgi:hypothetical protein
MGMAGVQRLLYPDPVGIKQESWICLSEGEFDALITRQHGLPTWTSTAGAASTLSPRWERYLAGKNVAIVYDCDPQGVAGSRAVARQLVEWDCRVRIVDLGLSQGHDLTDWFRTHSRSASELRDLIRETPPFTEPLSER